MSHKVALITGAGRADGLGVATARALAQLGYHVIVTARTDARAEERRARGGRRRAVGADGGAAPAARKCTRGAGGEHLQRELGTDDEDLPASMAAGWIAKAATLPAGGPSGAIFLDGRRIG